MTFTHFVLFAVGVILGSISCAILAERRRRRYLRETTALMQRSGNIQDRHYAMTNANAREALKALEAGDIQTAKHDLSLAIAAFYHCFEATANSSPEIKREREYVELDSRFSETLRVALRDDQPPV